MVHTSASFCVAEHTSRGEEEEEDEGGAEEETSETSGREIVLPNSFIAESLTSDIPMLYHC